MEPLGHLTADDMVASFLRAELASSRFARRIDAVCPADDPRRRWLCDPDVCDDEQNVFRSSVLRQTRGWTRGAGETDLAMAGVPADSAWQLVRMDRSELLAVRFIKEGWWITHTAGSRLPLDMVRLAPASSPARMTGNLIVPSLAAGVEPMVALGPSIDGPLTMAEGNGRLAAFALSDYPSHQVIVGTHPDMAEAWPYW